MRLKAVIAGLKDLRGGSFVSILSGAFSVSIVAAIRFSLGERDANLYLFLSALISLVGAVAAMGIPEYGQVLSSGKQTGALVVPIGLIVFVIIVVVSVFTPDARITMGWTWHFILLILVQIFIGAMLTVSELRFRCNLLSSNHISNYVYQNATPHLACIAAFLFLSSHLWGAALGACILIGGIFALWRTLTVFPLDFKLTFFLLNKEQGAFYLQRLMLVFIDSVLLLSARDSIQAAQYFAMGILSRVISPAFIVLNVYLARRQADILAGNLGYHARSTHLLLVSAAAGGAWGICSIVGINSAWSACFSILLIRFWVIILGYECQRWLPASPLILVVGSAAIWVASAWLIAMQSVSLVVISAVSIWINSVAAYIIKLLKVNYVE